MEFLHRVWRWCAPVLLFGIGMAAMGKGRALDESVRVSGSLYYKNQQISLGRMVYDNYTRSTFPGPCQAVFDVGGWDHFSAYLGLDDAAAPAEKVTCRVEVDGQVVWTHDFVAGDRAVAVEIPLTGARSLALSATDSAAVVAEPRLYTGVPEPTRLIDQLVQALIAARAAALKANNAEIAELVAAKLTESHIRVEVTEKATAWQFTR